MKLRVLEICKEIGITQKQLAERTKMSEVGLSKAINGNPTLETLKKIANALGVPITDLFASKEPISGIIIINGVTHRIESFDQLARLCDDLRPQLNA
jgi:transcriptional regulator with XRE-family HTH domain